MVSRSDTRRLLRAYSPLEDEQWALQAMAALAGHLPNTASPSHYDPGHFTASAFVTDRRHGRVLLVHHAKLGIWVQPGGHVEAGDRDLLQAAIRETWEETGVTAVSPDGDAVFDLDVHRIPVRGDVAAHLHFDVRFHLVASHEALVPSDEVTDARWVALDDVVALTTERSVLRPVGKLQNRRVSGGTP